MSDIINAYTLRRADTAALERLARSLGLELVRGKRGEASWRDALMRGILEEVGDAHVDRGMY